MAREKSKQKASENVTQRSVRKRNLAAQYKPLATLVAFANLAHQFNLKVEILPDSRDPLGRITTIGERDRAPIQKQLWEAAAKRFNWSSPEAPCYLPDFPDVSFGDEGEDFDYLDYLITLITTVNTCLRYLVERCQEARTERFFMLPSMPFAVGTLYAFTGDNRLSVMRRNAFERLFTTALESDKKRDYINVSKLMVCPICDRLFVAGRRDAFACSPPCLSVERERRYRDPKKGTAYRGRLKAIRKGRDEVRKRIARKLSLQPAPPTGGQ